MGTKPRWDLWQRMEVVSVYEAAALLLSVDPASLTYGNEMLSLLKKDLGLGNRRDAFVRGRPKLTKQLELVCQVAWSSIDSGSLRVLQAAGREGLRMSEFVRWAELKQFEVPPELKRLARIDPPPAAKLAPTSPRGEAELVTWKVILDEVGKILGKSVSEREARRQLHAVGISWTGRPVRVNREALKLKLRRRAAGS